MPLVRIATLACIALFLAACQSGINLGQDTGLKANRDASEEVKAGCQSDDCPLVNIDTLHFPAEPQLDAIIEQRLLQMTKVSDDQPVAPTLAAYRTEFLRTAPERYGTYLQAKVREQHDDLVIIELASYLNTGGAHGMPGRGFINYSLSQHRELSLNDMLLPGAQPAFWRAAAVAHNSWLIKTQLDRDPEFLKTWPFVESPHVALTTAGAVVKYDVYAIAPYSMGHIELTIPYNRLSGILKPELFPAALDD
ncbi:RsiV family protein [Pseudomonas sp. 5P_3.1_Bac2]|uniref:RsiV family protein n=1 Tax=Pseudomonas sp. 5P_3.1_Bac2 TaxID=2971617 RepID=UPI0021C7440F|nr:RsiV family protein [Pseudomonas sp. 5P_3.1_Bac2]MCU1718317.1 RsiV family protein [Pseudomonas sp. 5P_3.1_Bac2]